MHRSYTGETGPHLTDISRQSCSVFYRPDIQKTIDRRRPGSADSIPVVNENDENKDIPAERFELLQTWRPVELSSTARKACPAL